MHHTRRKKKYTVPQAPLTVQEKVSRSMRGNKAKDTKPELLLRRALWQEGLRGYRVHWRKAPGKPDVCYPGRHLAIFIHGCFWHNCPRCNQPLPKTNTTFWSAKFNGNRQRDERYKIMYREAGWQRVVIWECQLKQDIAGAVMLIKALHKGVPASLDVAA
ncbi:very short patch repair endonuclease [Pontibacter sp. SGAir0037]|uniref:very short patch repair endonuclease n=1 Tax=Pontibacter sp. SGAir0037 TaxID=2571030 RepID=UPI0010CD58AC|nr:very short patch repair endonuclease [Pontibacter sp. SGAir0037]QCR23847.1 very short patch repair endonuclease [Pontibacter sp. SGAir0037]